MLKSKPALYVSVSMIVIAMIMSFPFELNSPYGPERTSVLSIPKRTVEGTVYVGVITVSILLLGIVFLVIALKEYRARAVIMTVLLFMFGPLMIAEAYQTTFATGIDAISYDKERSTCSYEAKDETTMTAQCELYLQNHSKEDVSFKLTFYEEEFLKGPQYMNNGGPFDIIVPPKNENPIIVKRVLKLEKEQPFSGSDSHFNVILEAEGKKRIL
ncbi:hypothetical protein FZC76_19800 [Sutcliffiella horikoshii]|uniref:Uncharacterized protein n=1 Tax=Sutcliffiella horikoshii TaxID=79883 RepID=A0A5D4SNU2_9BACI|nr:hypothetical protein [Sutcliffiella horikoshii]TYS63466.1 hypothetical protein FZC76_19800 [Sutcliffiella horikoshii]